MFLLYPNVAQGELKPDLFSVDLGNFLILEVVLLFSSGVVSFGNPQISSDKVNLAILSLLRRRRHRLLLSYSLRKETEGGP